MKTTDKKHCPLTATAELLSDTWTMLIMRALTESPKRFSELKDWLGEISTRTLTLKLKRLQAEGLIIKTDTLVYTATKKGLGLKIIERAMIKYSERYLS
jgi:DNA-binding HxlR family transcriptional regulator